MKLAYGIVAPTGKYGSSASGTTTTDYWGHEMTFATTAYLDKTKLTYKAGFLLGRMNKNFICTWIKVEVGMGPYRVATLAIKSSFFKAH